jgi:hypothetical protein
MSLFGGSRFTAMLATIAILGTAGSLSWIIVTRTDLKSGVTGRQIDHPSPPKAASHISRLKNERANKLASFRRNERPQPAASAWNDDRGQLRQRPMTSRVFVDSTNPGLQDGGADMPLPVPPITRSDPETWQAKSPEPALFALQSVESQKRPTREPRLEPAAAVAPAATVAAPGSPKTAARSYYVEKLIEQGDAGEVKFRYRRQPCEPPNMPDVCFMPQESRRNIVVERR